MMLTNETKEQIIAAVADAGRGLLSAHDIESHMKVKPGDANFATAWDLETQRTLCARLHEIIPEAGFLAEEDAENAEDADGAGNADGVNTASAADTDERERDGEWMFIVDSIDGTTNFIHGLSHSAVSVALAKDGTPIFGCVCNPYLDEIFHAEAGCGAFLRRHGVDGRIKVSDRTLGSALCAFGTTPYERQYAGVTFELAKRIFLRSREVRREGSAALDICYVAAGRYDVYFEMKLFPWDFAAALVILREAGGVMSKLDGSPVDAKKPTSALASNIACRDEAVAVLGGEYGAGSDVI